MGRAPPILSRMKLLLRAGFVLVALVLLVLGLAFIFVDSIVRASIAKGGTYATGVPTTLESADVGLVDGKLALDGLKIANPEGFTSPAFLTLGSVRAGWENRSLVSDAIAIDEIAIDGVTLDLERANGRTNFGAILDHLEKVSGGKAEPEPGADAGGKKRTLTVKRVVVENVRASVHLAGLGTGPMSVTVPKVEIRDFQSDGSTTEIVGKLLAAIVPAILEATIDSGGVPAELKKELEGQLDRWKGEYEKAKETLKGLEGTLDGVKDLFKKPK